MAPPPIGRAARWFDSLAATLSPRWALQRHRSRLALGLMASYYDAASQGRRTQGWRRRAGDANAAVGAGQSEIRMHAHDLVRNNPWAASAVETIVNHIVGSWGITTEPEDERLAGRWRSWAETTACDAEGRHDLAGLQKLATRTVVTAGECLVRRRWRRPSDGLAIPLQLQVLEPDHLDATRQGTTTAGGQTIQGVEHDAIGRRIAYWLYPVHPGSTQISGGRFAPVRVPASEVLHVFRMDRPGQVRGLSWLAPVITRLKDFEDYEDAALMKQKIAACLAIITSDLDGTAAPLGATTTESPEIDTIEPGMIKNLVGGRQVTVVQPPSVSEHDAYSKTILRAVAKGLGITYEDATGSYEGMPYSAARLSRLAGWERVEGWRWSMLIPQFCEPVYLWFSEALMLVDDGVTLPAMDLDRWTAQPLPLIEPDREGLAYQRLVRSTLMSLSEVLRERGYRPRRVFEELRRDFDELRRMGLISDADPASTTQSGQLQGQAAAQAGAGASAGGALTRPLEQFMREVARQEVASQEPSRNGAEH